MKRQEGHYWIKYAGEWEIAFWRPAELEKRLGRWFVVGQDGSINNNDVEEVNESRILTPEEIDATEPYKGHIIAGKK